MMEQQKISKAASNNRDWDEMLRIVNAPGAITIECNRHWHRNGHIGNPRSIDLTPDEARMVGQWLLDYANDQQKEMR